MENQQNASATEVTSSVFIDMPNANIIGKGEYHRINWERLVAHINQHELEGTYPVHAGGYDTLNGEVEKAVRWLSTVRRKFNGLGFEVFARTAQDIDSWIINDIWMSIAKTQERQITRDEVLTFPLQMRHVIVSGDGGYLRAYRSLRETYGFNLELELVVYSWRTKLHQDYKSFASKIVYLDSIPDLILPIAT